MLELRICAIALLFASFAAVAACSGSSDETGHTHAAGGGSSGTGGVGGSTGGTGANGASGGTAGFDAGNDASTDATADAAPSWTLPACTSVSGTAAITFTSDEGATLAPNDGTLSGTVYTKGLVALESANVLLAASGASLIRSDDAGCHWKNVAALPGALMLLAKGAGDRVYGWQDNDQPLIVSDGTTVTSLKSPTPNVIGLGADRTKADHLRLGGSDASLWDSIDGGNSFSSIGVPPLPSTNLLAYRFAFDPANLDHVLFGAATDGAWMSDDGGKTWKKSSGLSAGGQANAFELVVSPVDSNVVWAEAIDLAENLANVPSEGRHVYWSNDGGASFAPVVDHDAANVTLTNGLLLVPHATDANVVYFEFGTYFQAYGTDIFRFDVASKTLDKTHNAYDDVSAIAFSPASSSLMYFGITQEQVN